MIESVKYNLGSTGQILDLQINSASHAKCSKGTVYSLDASKSIHVPNNCKFLKRSWLELLNRESYVFRSATETKLKSDLDSQLCGKRWRTRYVISILFRLHLIKCLETKLISRDWCKTNNQKISLTTTKLSLMGLLIELMKPLAGILVSFDVGKGNRLLNRNAGGLSRRILTGYRKHIFNKKVEII